MLAPSHSHLPWPVRSGAGVVGRSRHQGIIVVSKMFMVHTFTDWSGSNSLLPSLSLLNPPQASTVLRLPVETDLLVALPSSLK